MILVATANPGCTNLDVERRNKKYMVNETKILMKNPVKITGMQKDFVVFKQNAEKNKILKMKPMKF